MTDMLTFNRVLEFSKWRDSVGDVPVAAVLTMGALHDGHIALISEAKKYLHDNYSTPGFVVVTVFVNPTQFDDSTDFENYPHTLEQDVTVCAENEVSVLFCPTSDQVYPDGIDQIDLLMPSAAADVLDGPLRPNHFAGVVTVVSRLFDIIQPTVAFFGEKDYQQLVVIKDLVKQQQRAISIVPFPTVRASDGLALSSRNTRLSITGRGLAKHIPATISLVKHALAEGHDINHAIELGANYLHAQPGIELEYVEILSPQLTPVKEPGAGRVFVAVKIGGVRLIDNEQVEIGDANVAHN